MLNMLPGGLRCFVKERPDSDVVSVNVWVKAGSSFENESNRGIAHLLEHMVFNGTENYKSGEIDKAVENLGGELNAATSYDYTHYYINLPASYIDNAIRFLADIVCRPMLSGSMLKKEKPIVIEEIQRSLNDPLDILSASFMKNLYMGTPYQYPILGSAESVSSTNVDMLKSFHKNFYRPDRMVVSICGGIKESDVLNIISRNFAFKNNNYEKYSKTLHFKPESFSKEVELFHESVSNVHVLMGWRLDGLDRDADIYMDILESLLSTGKSSLLNRMIRETGKAFSASANHEQFFLCPNFNVYAVTNSLDTFKNGINDVVDRVLNVKDSDFELAKQKLKVSEIFDRESVQSEAEAIGYDICVFSDVNLYLNYIERLEGTTIDKFKNYARFLKQEPLIVTMKKPIGKTL